jgi:hypothetical protein
MVIKTIASYKLRSGWERDDWEAFPTIYRFRVRDVLYDLDAATVPDDLFDLGAKPHSEVEDAWYVTVTVNNVEPCGALSCIFYQGDCYDLDFKEYEP